MFSANKIAILYSVELNKFLSCITETFHVTEGRKQFLRGLHVGHP